MKYKNIIIITALTASLTGTVLALALLYLNFKALPELSSSIEIGNCFFPSIIVYGAVTVLNILLSLYVKICNIKNVTDYQSSIYQGLQLSKILGWINSLNAFPFGLLAAICIQQGQSSRIHIINSKPIT